MAVMTNPFLSEVSQPRQHLSQGSVPVRGHPRVPTPAERVRWNEEARQRLRSQSPLRRLAMALTSAIWRIVVHLESHQRRYPYQSPSSNHASFCRPKAVFLWRLVTKTAKTCWAVCSGDMSGLYIGPVWRDRPVMSRDCQSSSPMSLASDSASCATSRPTSANWE